MLLFCWPGRRLATWTGLLGPDLWDLVNGLPHLQALHSDHHVIQGGALAVRAKLGSSSCSAGQAWANHNASLATYQTVTGPWLVGGLSHQQALLWDSYKIQSGALAVRVKLGCVGCPAGHCMHWLMPDWQLELGPDLWGLVNCLPQWQVLYSDHYKIQGSAFVASAGPSCYSSLEGHRHQQITHQIIPDIQLEQWLGLSCY